MNDDETETESKLTYAEAILAHKNFKFQELSGVPLNLESIRKLNVKKVVLEVDIDTLQNFVKDVAFGDVKVSDFSDFSKKDFLRLFRLAQLITEYLLYVQDTLALNLNAVAAKYASMKKRMKRSVTANGRRSSTTEPDFAGESFLTDNRRLQVVYAPNGAWVEVSLPGTSTVRDLTEQVAAVIDIKAQLDLHSVLFKGVEVPNEFIIQDLGISDHVPFVIVKRLETPIQNAAQVEIAEIEREKRSITNLSGRIVEEIEQKLDSAVSNSVFAANKEILHQIQIITSFLATEIRDSNLALVQDIRKIVEFHASKRNESTDIDECARNNLCHDKIGESNASPTNKDNKKTLQVKSTKSCNKDKNLSRGASTRDEILDKFEDKDLLLSSEEGSNNICSPITYVEYGEGTQVRINTDIDMPIQKSQKKSPWRRTAQKFGLAFSHKKKANI